MANFQYRLLQYHNLFDYEVNYKLLGIAFLTVINPDRNCIQ